MGIGPSVSRASGHPSRARASRGAGSRRGARRFRAARTRIRVAERRGSLPRLFAPGYGRDASRFRHDASRYGHNSRMRVCASDSDAEATRMPGARRPHPSRIRVCVGPRPVLGPFWVWTLAGPYTHTHTHTHTRLLLARRSPSSAAARSSLDQAVPVSRAGCEKRSYRRPYSGPQPGAVTPV